MSLAQDSVTIEEAMAEIDKDIHDTLRAALDAQLEARIRRFEQIRKTVERYNAKYPDEPIDFCDVDLFNQAGFYPPRLAEIIKQVHEEYGQDSN